MSLIYRCCFDSGVYDSGARRQRDRGRMTEEWEKRENSTDRAQERERQRELGSAHERERESASRKRCRE